MEPLTCNDCNTIAVLKVSKAGKGYYDCPNCPSGNPSYKSKFLTFIEGVEEYKKKRSSPRQNCAPCDKIKEKVVGKRKAEKPLETGEDKRLKAMADEIEAQTKRISQQIVQTDLLLEKIERLLAPSLRNSES